ncbi:MAG: alpha/beta fold hydrolase [Candidatus Adiutrix sp.]|nr:alpha/beta fold hydrolase [Candidatus Adiutrix sp.]
MQASSTADGRHPARPQLAEYPFESRYFHRPDGLALHYLDEGRGPPALMLHGNPSWSFLWRRLISALAPDFRCLAPDHLGLGLSSRPLAGQYDFRLADRVTDLEALVEHWRPGLPLHLIMHDWGGPIGLAWAVRHPDRVASLTVINSGSRIPPGYRLPARLAVFSAFKPLGAFLAQRFNLFVRGTAACGTVQGLSGEARQGFLAPYARPEDRLAVARFVADIPLSPAHPSYDYLAETDRRLDDLAARRPLALIWGLRDFVFNRAVFLDWRERFPEAPALVLPEAGHYLLEDEPERVSDFVRQFLKKAQVKQ